MRGCHIILKKKDSSKERKFHKLQRVRLSILQGTTHINKMYLVNIKLKHQTRAHIKLYHGNKWRVNTLNLSESLSLSLSLPSGFPDRINEWRMNEWRNVFWHNSLQNRNTTSPSPPPSPAGDILQISLSTCLTFKQSTQPPVHRCLHHMCQHRTTTAATFCFINMRPNNAL